MIDIAKLEKQAGRYRREWNIEDAGFVVFTAGQWSDDLEAEGWLRNWIGRRLSFLTVPLPWPLMVCCGWRVVAMNMTGHSHGCHICKNKH